MIVRTSAKSRLTRPGIVIRSVMPGRLAEDVVGELERIDDRCPLLDDLEQAVVLDHDQRVDRVAEILDPALAAAPACGPRTRTAA